MSEMLFLYRKGLWKPYYSQDAVALKKKFKDGDTGWFSIRKPRNQGHHNKIFVMMDFVRKVTVAGDMYPGRRGSYQLLKAMQRAIGWVDEVKNIDGTTSYEAQSIAFDSMGQDKFELLYEDMFRAICHHFFYDSDVNLIRQELMMYEKDIQDKFEEQFG